MISRQNDGKREDRIWVETQKLRFLGVSRGPLFSYHFAVNHLGTSQVLEFGFSGYGASEASQGGTHRKSAASAGEARPASGCFFERSILDGRRREVQW
jgi:hypothetical protein